MPRSKALPHSPTQTRDVLTAMAQTKTLRVLSWNVYNENPNSDRVKRCLHTYAPDIAILQEALPQHIAVVANYFNNLTTGKDYLLKGEACFLVIASDYSLRNISTVRHFQQDKPYPSPFAKFMQWTEFLDTISADVVINSDISIRSVALHTSAGATPSTRLVEISQTVNSHIFDHGPAIIAGDFNNFGHPLLSPIFALPLAYRLQDICVQETKAHETLLSGFGFSNTVNGITFPKFLTQTDYIYIRNLIYKWGTLSVARFGSDHRPLIVDLDISKSANC